MREKLIELIGSTEYGKGSLIGNNFQKRFIEKIADHLISHGVTFKTTKVKPKKKPVKKEISQETLNALTTMGRKVHGEV